MHVVPIVLKVLLPCHADRYVTVFYGFVLQSCIKKKWGVLIFSGSAW